jgi:hypothetical protein
MSAIRNETDFGQFLILPFQNHLINKLLTFIYNLQIVIFLSLIYFFNLFIAQINPPSQHFDQSKFLATAMNQIV